MKPNKPSSFNPGDKYKASSGGSPQIEEFDLDENIHEMDEEINHEVVSSKNFEAKSKNNRKVANETSYSVNILFQPYNYFEGNRITTFKPINLQMSN